MTPDLNTLMEKEALQRLWVDLPSDIEGKAAKNSNKNSSHLDSSGSIVIRICKTGILQRNTEERGRGPGAFRTIYRGRERR